MPLSKKKMRDRKRLARLLVNPYLPEEYKQELRKDDALRLKSNGIKEVTDNTAPPVLDASGEVIPEYY